METEPTNTAFPEEEVRLLGGSHVIVKPWPLSTGKLVTKRIFKMLASIQNLRGQGVDVDPTNVEELLQHFEQDIIDIISLTISKDEEWMNEHMHYEDLVDLANAIVRICIVREGSEGKLGGVVGKLMGAGGAADLVGIDPKMAARMDQVRQLAKTETSQKPEDSPSSPGEGTEAPSS